MTSSRSDIEEEIARALAEHDHNYDSDCGLDFGCTCGAIDEYKSADEHADHLTEVLSPLLNRVRAEALREAATDLNERFQDIPAWTEAYREGVRTDDWMQGGVRMTMSAIDVLRTRADRIDQNSEGNET